ncbi:hypothetical protein ACI2L1_44625, partial [Streptomyces sp. NPDC019531]|uniref:hypothetical protein n=1 Tax=Streptomyces sp. NPDC019531 TaxID=3365062 RepID=UPI003850D218
MIQARDADRGHSIQRIKEISLTNPGTGAEQFPSQGWNSPGQAAEPGGERPLLTHVYQESPVQSATHRFGLARPFRIFKQETVNAGTAEEYERFTAIEMPPKPPRVFHHVHGRSGLDRAILRPRREDLQPPAGPAPWMSDAHALRRMMGAALRTTPVTGQPQEGLGQAAVGPDVRYKGADQSLHEVAGVGERLVEALLYALRHSAPRPLAEARTALRLDLAGPLLAESADAVYAWAESVSVDSELPDAAPSLEPDTRLTPDQLAAVGVEPDPQLKTHAIAMGGVVHARDVPLTRVQQFRLLLRQGDRRNQLLGEAVVDLLGRRLGFRIALAEQGRIEAARQLGAATGPEILLVREDARYLAAVPHPAAPQTPPGGFAPPGGADLRGVLGRREVFADGTALPKRLVTDYTLVSPFAGTQDASDAEKLAKAASAYRLPSRTVAVPADGSRETFPAFLAAQPVEVEDHPALEVSADGNLAIAAHGRPNREFFATEAVVAESQKHIDLAGGKVKLIIDTSTRVEFAHDGDTRCLLKVTPRIEGEKSSLTRDFSATVLGEEHGHLVLHDTRPPAEGGTGATQTARANFAGAREISGPAYLAQSLVDALAAAGRDDDGPVPEFSVEWGRDLFGKSGDAMEGNNGDGPSPELSVEWGRDLLGKYWDAMEQDWPAVGKEYGQAQFRARRDPEVARRWQELNMRLGVNEAAIAQRPGDGYVIQALAHRVEDHLRFYDEDYAHGTDEDTPLIQPTAGYHFAPVVAGDENHHIALQVFSSRRDFDQDMRDAIEANLAHYGDTLDAEAARLQTVTVPTDLRFRLARQLQIIRDTRAEIAALEKAAPPSVLNPAELVHALRETETRAMTAAITDMSKLSVDTYGDPNELWFFTMHGRSLGESFYDRWAGDGSVFSNPLVALVKGGHSRTKIGVAVVAGAPEGLNDTHRERLTNLADDTARMGLWRVGQGMEPPTIKYTALVHPDESLQVAATRADTALDFFRRTLDERLRARQEQDPLPGGGTLRTHHFELIQDFRLRTDREVWQGSTDGSLDSAVEFETSTDGAFAGELSLTIGELAGLAEAAGVRKPKSDRFDQRYTGGSVNPAEALRTRQLIEFVRDATGESGLPRALPLAVGRQLADVLRKEYGQSEPLSSGELAPLARKVFGLASQEPVTQAHRLELFALAERAKVKHIALSTVQLRLSRLASTTGSALTRSAPRVRTAAQFGAQMLGRLVDRASGVKARRWSEPQLSQNTTEAVLAATRYREDAEHFENRISAYAAEDEEAVAQLALLVGAVRDRLTLTELVALGGPLEPVGIRENFSALHRALETGLLAELLGTFEAPAPLTTPRWSAQPSDGGGRRVTAWAFGFSTGYMPESAPAREAGIAYQLMRYAVEMRDRWTLPVDLGLVRLALIGALPSTNQVLQGCQALFDELAQQGRPVEPELHTEPGWRRYSRILPLREEELRGFGRDGLLPDEHALNDRGADWVERYRDVAVDILDSVSDLSAEDAFELEKQLRGVMADEASAGPKSSTVSRRGAYRRTGPYSAELDGRVLMLSLNERSQTDRGFAGPLLLALRHVAPAALARSAADHAETAEAFSTWLFLRVTDTDVLGHTLPPLDGDAVLPLHLLLDADVPLSPARRTQAALSGDKLTISDADLDPVHRFRLLRLAPEHAAGGEVPADLIARVLSTAAARELGVRIALVNSDGEVAFYGGDRPMGDGGDTDASQRPEAEMPLAVVIHDGGHYIPAQPRAPRPSTGETSLAEQADDNHAPSAQDSVTDEVRVARQTSSDEAQEKSSALRYLEMLRAEVARELQRLVPGYGPVDAETVQEAYDGLPSRLVLRGTVRQRG